MTSTFVLIHGAGDIGWSWHLVAEELRTRGYEVLAPDLPSDDETLTLTDYADSVVAAVEQAAISTTNLTVVGHSFGGFTAPLVADRLQADVLVLLAAMVPQPGEPPEQWWDNVGFAEAVRIQAERDGGLTGSDDPYEAFFADVPRELAERAMANERAHPSSTAMAQPWPLEAWPDVTTRFLLCRDDHFFPLDLFRRLVPDRLDLVPDEMPGSHGVALSRPKDLADRLEQYAG
ncbi:alpha/beta hydrolase [Propionibacteriaceae bacterium Y1685]